MSDMTIGQIVDVLRQKCMEDLGVDNIKIEITSFSAPGHEKAEMTAIRMAHELNGAMSGIKKLEGYPDTKMYSVRGINTEYWVVWEEKEKATYSEVAV